VQVAVLKNGVWTKLPRAEDVKNNVKVGDTVRLYGKGNATTSRMRFKSISPNGQPVFNPEWKEGVLDDSGDRTTVQFYTDLKINTAGRYSFEAQIL
jgi:hypothetical protein